MILSATVQNRSNVPRTQRGAETYSHGVVLHNESRNGRLDSLPHVFFVQQPWRRRLVRYGRVVVPAGRYFGVTRLGVRGRVCS